MHQGLSDQGRDSKIQYIEKLIHCSRDEIRPINIEKALREIHIDTNATSTSIGENLSHLDTYIAAVGRDINKFNVHVKTLIQSLLARREERKDLMADLFKG